MSTLSEAIRFYEQKQYKEAFFILNNNSFNNNLEALLYRGFCYYFGQGTIKDYKKAFDCLSTCAINRIKASFILVGRMYELGRGVIKNLLQAELYYTLAIKENIIEGYYRLGNLYIDIDLKKAFLYLDVAIEHNHFKAIALKANYSLDDEQSEILLIKAANLGDIKAKYKLALIYLEKQTNPEIAEAYLLDSINIYSDALYLLGENYLEGSFFKKDVKKGIKYLKQGTKALSTDCTRLLATCYNMGQGLKKDINQAIYLLQQCIRKNDIKSIYLLCEIYYNNDISNRFELIVFYLKKAAKLGDINANYQLGKIYLEGFGNILKDYNLSYKYFQAAYDLGQENAATYLNKFKKNFRNKITIKE